MLQKLQEILVPQIPQLDLSMYDPYEEYNREFSNEPKLIRRFYRRYIEKMPLRRIKAFITFAKDYDNYTSILNSKKYQLEKALDPELVLLLKEAKKVNERFYSN